MITEPVHLKKFQDTAIILKHYIKNQPIFYTCEKCGKEVYTTKGYWNKTFFCKGCKTKQTNMKKYGVENPSQLQEIKEKKKQTCLKHYGVENPTYIENHVEKVKKSCLEKYGTDWGMQSKEVQEKSRQTCLEKYGTEYSIQNEQVQEKKKKTVMKKYGVTNPTYIPDHNEKVKKTCLKKYGVENVSQSKLVKEKMKQTCFNHFGVENPSQVETIKKIKIQKFKQTWGQKTPEELKLIRSKAIKKYNYQDQSFDSSWELAVWVYIQDHKEQFGVIKREPIALTYVFKKEKHIYYPDFQIGNKLVEIKGPQFFKPDGTMCNPFDHSKDELFEAKYQCGLRHGVEFWREKEMEPILQYLENMYGKNWSEKFKQ